MFMQPQLPNGKKLDMHPSSVQPTKGIVALAELRGANEY
jgi:hypothetical protein